MRVAALDPKLLIFGVTVWPRVLLSATHADLYWPVSSFSLWISSAVLQAPACLCDLSFSSTSDWYLCLSTVWIHHVLGASLQIFFIVRIPCNEHYLIKNLNSNKINYIKGETKIILFFINLEINRDRKIFFRCTSPFIRINYITGTSQKWDHNVLQKKLQAKKH